MSPTTRHPAQRSRLQVVVAHPDDETFGCGSLLLHAADRGARTAVVCASRGEAGESTVPYDDLGATREAELRAAARVLGVERVDLLGFADSGMAGEPAPGTVCGATEDDLVSGIVDAVRAFSPDVLVTLDGSDGHRDHVRVRDAVLRAAEVADVPRVYVSCLSRSLMRRWADHQQVVAPGSPYLDVDAIELGTPDEEMTTLVDVRVHRSVLDRAMAAHASQSSPYADLPEGLADAFLDTARARRVVPPWTGGSPETQLLA
ncbi:PIG-L family deacetylase [Nocardioides sp. STR2]|uniref:PIG-L family deacetylase n=1 Tax=Nocardioides pini TaxID=2975053 RepID=A0ABT4CDV0_9ACTN|nr:PIG-L family deacetylase [Nocardioides pini]MCY4727142.1 PIG-L family deacetylase [Nocardioides pini]